MSFAAKVPLTRRSKYTSYRRVNAASPGDTEGERRPRGSPAPSPFLNRGRPSESSDSQLPQSQPYLHPRHAGRPLSNSSIDGRGTPTRLSRLNRPKSIEEISEALGDQGRDDEEQVVVMVMARATEDGNYRITMPDSGSDDPEKGDVPDMATERRSPRPGPRAGSYGRAPSTASSMPDEFFLPMGGPQLTSSRLSQNAPQFYKYPVSPTGGYFPTIDEADFTPPECQYTCWDIFVNLFSAGSYVADVGTDMFVAYLHFRAGNWWWFSLTLAFVLVPSLVITIFSLAWYYQDHADCKQNDKPSVSYARWVSRLLFHMLQLGPVIR